MFLFWALIAIGLIAVWTVQVLLFAVNEVARFDPGVLQQFVEKDEQVIDSSWTVQRRPTPHSAEVTFFVLRAGKRYKRTIIFKYVPKAVSVNPWGDVVFPDTKLEDKN